MKIPSLLALAAAATAATAAATPLQRGPAVSERTQAAQDTARKPLPLRPGRVLDLRTNVGSWISLDVSPDGRTIVFDLLGDLYVLAIEGGKARQLTSGMAYDAQPRFSPDGRGVVFVSDRSGGDNVWVISVDGRTTTQVTKGNDNLYVSPEWTPDGSYVVASNGAKPWLYHVEGGAGVQLVKDPGNVKLLGPAFGPDPRYIWLAQRQGDWQYNAMLAQYQLTVYDRKTGGLTTMSTRYGGGFRPAPSPNGQWLVYGTRHEEHTGLVLRDLRTGDERWLAYPIQRDDQEAVAALDVLPGYAFMPDSRAVVLSYGGEIWRVPVDGSAPAKIPFTVETQLALGPKVHFAYRIDDAPEFTVRQIRDAVPSPDGRRLAFTALNELYVMDWPDGRPHRLAAAVRGGKFYPTWSPDGRVLAFATWDDREGGYIWRTLANGRDEPRRLTDLSGFYQQIVWSPAGDRIVALRAAARTLREDVSADDLFIGFDPDQGAELVWVPAGGGAVTMIAPSGGRSRPHFAGDADRIYASSPQQGLVSFRWDGTDVRGHVKVTSAAHSLSAVPLFIAPDRTRALAQVGSDIYAVTVPFAGGETPTVSVATPETSAFPVHKLTKVGGEFPAWSADGRKVHWSLGNAHFIYDLDRANAFERRIAIRARRDIPQGVAVLRGGRAITMRGSEIIRDADIVVRDHRIVAVGPRGQVAVPAGAKVIDVSGKTVVPGFVDTHAHMWPARGTHTSDVWQYPVTLAYGVTTTRDPYTVTTDILTYQERVETGDLIGPRIYSTGPAIRFERMESLERAKDVLRRYSDYYDTKTFKVYMGNRQERQWLIMAARELELTPTVEAGLSLRLDMTVAIDGYAGLEHTLPIFPIYDDVVDLFKTSGITHTPTLVGGFGGPFGENWFFTTENVHDDPKLRRFTPHADIDYKARRRGGNWRGLFGPVMGPTGWALREEYVFDHHARFAKDLIEAGGKVAVGSHGQLQGLGYHWELWALQSGGMSQHDALRAATILGAEAIGFDQDLGSIEPGKLADLVVLERDPLADIRNTKTIRYVMKNGRLYEGETLNEVYPRSRPFERRYYWTAEPTVTGGGWRRSR